MKTLAIVIPAYNESPILGKLLDRLPDKITGVDNIIPIIIDDGSTDGTAKIKFKKGTIYIRHPINLGVGAATRTGFTATKMLGADIVVTLDGDGQHSPSDLPKLIQPLVKNQADVSFGNRFIDVQNMPVERLFGNRLLTFITWLTTGLNISDSQCGYRGYTKKAIKKMKLSQAGFEICSEIAGEVKRNKLNYVEIPVKTIYNNISYKKSQSPFNAFNIIMKMIERLLWN